MTRRTTLLVAAITATLGSVLIAPTFAHGSANALPVAQQRTIRLVEGDGPSGGLDVNPKGDSIGDYFAFHSPLHDLTGARVGRADAYSIITGVGNAAAALHFVTLTLPGGQITTQNAELATVDNGNGPEAITGGTGDFQNVRGQLTFEEDQGRVVIVLHLIG
jgi:hypothetical protein